MNNKNNDNEKLKQTKITHIATGVGFTLILNSKGEVFGCGDNTYGSLGQPSHIKSISFPHIISFPHKQHVHIVQILCGGKYAFLKSSNGSYWVIGRNDYGQLGINNLSHQYQPKLFFYGIDRGIIDISTGFRHVLMIDRNRNGYSVGFNNHRQLGAAMKNPNYNPVGRKGEMKMGKKKMDKRRYRMIPSVIGGMFRKKVKKMFTGCCSNSSFMIVDEGNGEESVWGCGNNENGQLGLGKRSGHQELERISKFNGRKVVDIQSGAFKTCFITADNDIFFCGVLSFKNRTTRQISHGQLLQMNAPIIINYISIPILINKDYINNERVVSVSADGFKSLIFLTEEKNVFVYGYNEYGQLGCGDTDHVQRPKRIVIAEDVEQISSGRRHNVLLAKNGSILVCGNNASGELGLGVESEELPKSTSFVKMKNFESIKPITYIERKKVECNVMSKMLRKVSNTKIINEDCFTIVFDSGLEEKIYCSYAIQSPFLKNMIMKNKFKLKLNSCYYLAIEKINQWLLGQTPDFVDSKLLKSTYLLSLEWKLPQLSMYLIKFFKNNFSSKVNNVLEVMFDLNEEMTECGLFVMCKRIVLEQRSTKSVNEKLFDYLKNDDFSVDARKRLFNLITMGDQGNNEEKVDIFSCYEFENVELDLSYDNEKTFIKHVNGLLLDSISKNLILLTTDKKKLCVHREILAKTYKRNIEYFKVMFEGHFLEAKGKVVRVALQSSVLIPLILYCYEYDLRYDLMSPENLLLLRSTCEKFMIPDISRDIDDEMSVKKNLKVKWNSYFQLLERNVVLENELSHLRHWKDLQDDQTLQENEKDPQIKKEDVTEEKIKIKETLKDNSESDSILFDQMDSVIEKKVKSLLEEKDKSDKLFFFKDKLYDFNHPGDLLRIFDLIISFDTNIGFELKKELIEQGLDLKFHDLMRKFDNELLIKRGLKPTTQLLHERTQVDLPVIPKKNEETITLIQKEKIDAKNNQPQKESEQEYKQVWIFNPLNLQN